MSSVQERIVERVLAERRRQDLRWGPPSHPNVTGSAQQRALAREARERCQAAFAAGTGGWSHVLAEEVAEAHAEEDLDRLQNELVQVAAVTFAWLEDLAQRPHAS